MNLPAITDDEMRARLGGARTYTLMILRRTPKYERPAAEPIVWEHVRRNFALGDAGLLNIVCPVADETDVAGIGLFNAEPERVRAIYEADPGVQAGIFSVEIHSCPRLSRVCPGRCPAGLIERAQRVARRVSAAHVLQQLTPSGALSTLRGHGVFAHLGQPLARWEDGQSQFAELVFKASALIQIRAKKTTPSPESGIGPSRL